jgi:hypothetical protein
MALQQEHDLQEIKKKTWNILQKKPSITILVIIQQRFLKNVVWYIILINTVISLVVMYDGTQYTKSPLRHHLY